MPNTYYATKISPHRGKTDEGYLICSKVPVARIGYQFYLDKELGFEPSEKIKKENNGYNVYRPEEEVFSEETLSSFEGKPITDDHPQEQVTSDNFQIYAKGNIKNVQRGQGEYKDFILADLVIWDKELVNKIENGKQAVSVGYSCDYEEHGKELWQKDIICNHIAIVDEGRAGEKAVIRDNSPKNKEEATMPEEVKKEEEKKEEVVEKDKCKDEAPEEEKEEKEEKTETKDSVDLAEVIQNLVSRVEALESRMGSQEKTGFDALEEEIFKEKKEEVDEEAPEKIIEKEKEVVGDSVLLDFVRQVKPLVAKLKDKKQSKLLEDSMCKIIRGTLMNDSKKKPEKEEKSVYTNFISKDTSIQQEENPYDKLFNKFKGEK